MKHLILLNSTLRAIMTIQFILVSIDFGFMGTQCNLMTLMRKLRKQSFVDVNFVDKTVNRKGKCDLIPN